MLIHYVVTSCSIRHIDQSLRFSKLCRGLKSTFEISFIVAIRDLIWSLFDARHVTGKPRIEFMTVLWSPVVCISLELVGEIWLDLDRAPEAFPRSDSLEISSLFTTLELGAHLYISINGLEACIAGSWRMSFQEIVGIPT